MSVPLAPTLSLPDAPLAAEGAAAPLPGPLVFARAVAGYALVGWVAVVGPSAVPADSGAAVVSALGALVLTVPALLVVHPFLGLQASPAALVSAVARPFTRTGDIALGLVPALLLFRATSGLAPLLLCLMLLGLAFLGFSLSIHHLVEAERSADPNGWRVGKMTLLAWAWSGLACLIGARLGLGVLAGW